MATGEFDKPSPQGPIAPGAIADAVRARRAFLSHLRHDLRTPINAIIGYGEMLLEDAQDRDEKPIAADLARILSAGKQLSSQVDALLDDDKVESGQRQYGWQAFEAHVRRELRMPIDVITATSATLLADATARGQEDLAADLRYIGVAVERLLAGIDRLVQLSTIGVDDQALSDFGATLALVRDAVAAIPALAKDGVRVTKEGSLLLVDDSDISRELISRQLGREGYTVTCAENGRQALELIRGRAFDLILLDIMMPEVNGFEVLRCLKSDAKWTHIPVLMISALDELDSVVRCIEIGAEDYLQKPINPVLLNARIDVCLERKRLRDREQAYLKQLSVEREKSERLLLNILPAPISERLKKGETTIADSFKEATVLFSDLVGFTSMSSRMQPSELVWHMSRIFSAFDRLAERYDLEKIKTIGDAYMIVGGVPVPRQDHAEAIADMALGMVEAIVALSAASGESYEIRIGIHTGSVVAGIIGMKKFAYDLWGDTVNTASRMESHGLPGKIQVSGVAYECLKGKYRFENRGLVEIKGKGEMNTYFLVGRR